MVASAEKEGVELIAVVFNVNGWDHLHQDIITLFEYGFSMLQLKTLAQAGSVIEQITISNGIEGNNTLNIVVEDTLKATFSTADYIEAFSPSIEIKKKLKAPIQEGEIVGSITYDIYHTTYTSHLIAGNSIEAKPTILSETIKTTKSIFEVVIKILILSLLAIIILFIAIVFIRAYIITKRQRMRSHKRHKYNSRFH